MKVSELTGAKLDYWTARAEGFSPFFTKLSSQGQPICTIGVSGDYGGELARFYRPSTDWAQGGPLIEKYKLVVDWLNDGTVICAPSSAMFDLYGATPLIAICRAVVRSVFGDEVEDV